MILLMGTKASLQSSRGPGGSADIPASRRPAQLLMRSG